MLVEGVQLAQHGVRRLVLFRTGQGRVRRFVCGQVFVVVVVVWLSDPATGAAVEHGGDCAPALAIAVGGLVREDGAAGGRSGLRGGVPLAFEHAQRAVCDGGDEGGMIQLLAGLRTRRASALGHRPVLAPPRLGKPPGPRRMPGAADALQPTTNHPTCRTWTYSQPWASLDSARPSRRRPSILRALTRIDGTRCVARGISMLCC